MNRGRFNEMLEDECLKKVAIILRKALKRPGDIVARYGGEEFVALLPNTNVKGSALVAEEMHHMVEVENPKKTASLEFSAKFMIIPPVVGSPLTSLPVCVVDDMSTCRGNIFAP